MSCHFQDIRCPNCNWLYKIEDRQEIFFCNRNCGKYFDRSGAEREWNHVAYSSTPLADGLLDALHRMAAETDSK